MRLATAFVAATALGLLAARAHAQGQPDFSKIEIKATPLGNNTFMLQGAGGNMMVAVGEDGVIQVDDEFAPLHDKIAAAVATVSGGKPVKYLINTHFHPDHAGGNENFAKDGITLVAHENLALRLAHGSVNGLSGQKMAPAPKMAIPTKTYTTEGLQLMVKGQTAVVNHPEHAHTDTDSYVYFPAANVIATGDVVCLFRDRHVQVDYANGGNLNGIISAVETLIKLGNDQTKYVPGHGPLATRADLQTYHDMLVDVRNALQAEITAGKTEDQAVADHPLAKLASIPSTNHAGDDAMVQMSYRSLENVKANPL